MSICMHTHSLNLILIKAMKQNMSATGHQACIEIHCHNFEMCIIPPF